MRFIITAQAGTDETTAGTQASFDEGVFVAYMKFNEEMHKAGILVDVRSLDEAIQWALRAPSGSGIDDVLEIRQLTGACDIPPEIRKIINSAAPTWSASVWQARE